MLSKSELFNKLFGNNNTYHRPKYVTASDAQ